MGGIGIAYIWYGMIRSTLVGSGMGGYDMVWSGRGGYSKVYGRVRHGITCTRNGSV